VDGSFGTPQPAAADFVILTAGGNALLGAEVPRAILRRLHQIAQRIRPLGSQPLGSHVIVNTIYDPSDGDNNVGRRASVGPRTAASDCSDQWSSAQSRDPDSPRLTSWVQLRCGPSPSLAVAFRFCLVASISASRVRRRRSTFLRGTRILALAVAPPRCFTRRIAMSAASQSAEPPHEESTLDLRREGGRIRSFDPIVDDTTTVLMSGLAASIWNPSTWRGRPWDAEHRKLYGRLLASFGDLRRLEAENRPLDDRTRSRLTLLLSAPRALGSTDSTLELVDEVRKALVPIGDESYLRPLLVDEQNRELRRAQRTKTGSPRSSTLVGWSEVYPGEPVAALLVEPFDIERARKLLLAFYECRREREGCQYSVPTFVRGFGSV
jgi:hypothetical protein